jgi:hypothetical protein
VAPEGGGPWILRYGKYGIGPSLFEETLRVLNIGAPPPTIPGEPRQPSNHVPDFYHVSGYEEAPVNISASWSVDRFASQVAIPIPILPNCLTW